MAGTASDAATVILSAASRAASVGDSLARAHDFPCTLVLEVPALNFTVGTLMRLRPGSLVFTGAQQNEDISLKVNGLVVGMAEFDVVGDTLAVRLTSVA